MHSGNSTPRFRSVLSQAEFIPNVMQKLQKYPQGVLDDFESIREHSRVNGLCFDILIEQFI